MTIDTGLLNQLNQRFQDDFRSEYRHLHCTVELNERTSVVTLNFDQITRMQVARLHNLCNRHRRQYVVEPSQIANNKIAYVIYPPENWP